MSRMLYAQRPGLKTIAVVDTRSEKTQKEQDAAVGGIYATVRSLPDTDEDARRRQVAHATYVGYDQSAERTGVLQSREAHRGLAANHRSFLTTALIHVPQIAPLITQGEWAMAAGVLKFWAPDALDPKHVLELAVALELLEEFGMEDRHEAADKVVAAV